MLNRLNLIIKCQRNIYKIDPTQGKKYKIFHMVFTMPSVKDTPAKSSEVAMTKPVTHSSIVD